MIYLFIIRRQNKISAQDVLLELTKNQSGFSRLINSSFETARKKLKIIDKIYQKAYPRFKVEIFLKK